MEGSIIGRIEISFLTMDISIVEQKFLVYNGNLKHVELQWMAPWASVVRVSFVC